jgi:hypothetical protein
MENTPAFDLKDAIRGWREKLCQSPSFRPEDLDELETHLRDSVAAMRHTALSEEECFWIACQRLGGNAPLEHEFAKVNQREVWTERLLWMLIGVLVWWAAASCAHAGREAGLVTVLLAFGLQPEVPGSLLWASLLAVVQLGALAACVLGCAWVLNRAGDRLGKTADCLVQSRLRLVLAVIAISVIFLAVQGAYWLEVVYLPRAIQLESYGAWVRLRTTASVLASPLQTIALVGAALLVARRRFQRGSRPSLLPEGPCRR